MGGVLGLGSIVPGLSAYKGHTVALDVQCSLGYSAPLHPAKFETNWGGGGRKTSYGLCIFFLWDNQYTQLETIRVY